MRWSQVLVCAAVSACGAPRTTAVARDPRAPGVARALASLEGCLFGALPATTEAGALRARARRMALGTGGAWPADCATASATLRHAAAGTRADLAPLARLDQALAEASAHVEGFVAGRADGDVATAWVATFPPVHRALSTWITAQGASLAPPAPGARTPVATVVQDVAPLPLTAESVRVGASAAGGTLTVMFREGTDAVVCRTRDGGATLRCRRMADADPRGAARALIEHDRAEALVLFDRAGTQRIEALDVPDVTAFAVPGTLAAGRVTADALYGALTAAGHGVTARVVRAGAARATPSSLDFSGGAAVVHGADPSVHQAFSVVMTGAAAALATQGIGGAAGERIALTGLTSGRIASCQADAAGYVLVRDGARSVVVALDQGAPRVLGTTPIGGDGARLACDGAGVAVYDGERGAWCAREGACDAATATPGLLSAARAHGALWGVTRTREGALRIWRGARFSQWRPSALADDAAHGGMSADRAWLEPAGERVVLLTQGAVNMVLSSEDGAQWRSAREAD